MGEVRARLGRRFTLAAVITGALVAVVAAPAQALDVSTGKAGQGVATTTLWGYVTPGDVATDWAFAYGTSTSYGLWSSTGVVNAGTGATLVAAQLTGLTPNTTYHYRVVAAPFTASPLDPTAGLAGDDETFTTQPEQLELDSPALVAKTATVSIPLQCASATTCTGRLMLRTASIRGRRAVTCAQASLTMPSWLDQALGLNLSSGCRKLLKKAHGHRLSAVLSARLSSGQLGFSAPVVLSG